MRILSVFVLMAIGASFDAAACNQHPPDVSHERWLAQINQWNKEYDAKQAEKAKAAAEVRSASPRDRGRTATTTVTTDNPAPLGRVVGDPQVRSVGRQPQSLAPALDARRVRRYR